MQPKLDPHKAFIDDLLATDRQMSRKQRHTAVRIFKRLKDERAYEGHL